jgi:hypothetical protein
MTTVTHEPTREAPAKKHFSEFLASEMWASLAISVIWLSVLFEAIYAPAIETRSAGGDYSSVPTAIIGTIFRVPRDVGLGQACVSARHGGPLEPLLQDPGARFVGRLASHPQTPAPWLAQSPALGRTMTIGHGA